MGIVTPKTKGALLVKDTYLPKSKHSNRKNSLVTEPWFSAASLFSVHCRNYYTSKK